MFRPQKTLKKTKIKLYNTLALLALLYDTENWTIIARDARRITIVQIKCVIKTTGNIWTDYTTNRDCKRTIYNSSFGYNTGTQNKLIATYKQNAA
jgi:hypothetical protein